MPSLSKENRKLLENTVAAARVIAVKGATTVLRDQYAVGESAPWPHMSDLENKLRVKLRAHGRQLGDRRGPIAIRRSLIGLHRLALTSTGIGCSLRGFWQRTTCCSIRTTA